MNYEEAIEWLRGKRSLTNIIPSEPPETWLVRIVEADANMMKQAYWLARAYKEELIPSVENAE